MSTSRKSNASSPKGTTRATAPATSRSQLDREFDRDILNRARQIVMSYRLVIHPSSAEGFMGHSVELPGVMAGGSTHEQCVRAVVWATETAVATILEMGQNPPSPASARRRTEQINIRLTAEEKLLLEEESQRRGFRGVSDFVRAAVLDRV